MAVCSHQPRPNDFTAVRALNFVEYRMILCLNASTFLKWTCVNIVYGQYDNRKTLSGQHFKQTKRTMSLKAKPKEDISAHKIQESFHTNRQTGIRRLVSSILEPGCLAEKLSQSMMIRDLRLQHHLPDSSS